MIISILYLHYNIHAWSRDSIHNVLWIRVRLLQRGIKVSFSSDKSSKMLHICIFLPACTWIFSFKVLLALDVRKFNLFIKTKIVILIFSHHFFSFVEVRWWLPTEMIKIIRFPVQKIIQYFLFDRLYIVYIDKKCPLASSFPMIECSCSFSVVFKLYIMSKRWLWQFVI